MDWSVNVLNRIVLVKKINNAFLKSNKKKFTVLLGLASHD